MSASSRINFLVVSFCRAFAGLALVSFVLGLCVQGVRADEPSVLVFDPFTDGGTTEGADPADVRWFTSDGPVHNVLSVVEDVQLDSISPNRVVDFLIANPVVDAKDDYLFFALPQTVTLQVGQALQLTMKLRFQGGPPRADASRTGIALAYRDPAASQAPWSHASNREYSMLTSFGHTGLLGSIRKSSGAAFLNGGTALAPESASFNVGQAPGDVFFEAALLSANTLRLRYRINGGPVQEAFDISDLTTAFNRVYLRYRRATAAPLESLRLDDMRVVVTNADPAPIPASVWHVSAQGSDSQLGNSPAAAFRTINWALQWARPGDTVRIAGGVYREMLAPPRTGTADAPIVIEAARDAHGQPEDVLITGFDFLTPSANGLGAWQLHAGNIWKIALPAGYALPFGRNLVEANGEILRPARWPDVTTPLDFDRRHMATASGGGLGAGPFAHPPYTGDFYAGHYLDAALAAFPPGHWAGAHIDLCPGHNWWPKTGVVTGNNGNRVDFNYRYVTNFNPILDIPKGADRYTLWGHLNALDSPGEFFVDVNGINGPANTLYLWLPDGSTPVGKNVALLRRQTSLNILDRSHLVFRDLRVRGGTVTMGATSQSNRFDGIEVEYGATNRNLLVTGNNDSVRLVGTSHVFASGRVSHTYGRSVRAEGTNIQILNTVSHDASSHLLSAGGAQNALLAYNTAFRGGDTAVDIGARASIIEFNHVYHGGMRLTDIALMNTWNSGDMQGTEVRYNWAHSNLAPWDLSLNWYGGQGIRLDSGGAPLGCSNIFIHHNVVWGTTAASSITFWGLEPTMVNHGNAQIRVYHNTVSASLVFGGSGSVAGNDVRNNIARAYNNPTGSLTGITFADNLFSGMTVPGNLQGDPDFVSPMNHNFLLGSASAAVGVGSPIAGFTEAATAEAPVNYLGAYKPGTPPWRPGARLRLRDLAGLSTRVEFDARGQGSVILEGLPIGRTLPDTFGLRLNGQEASEWFTRYDFETHQVTGVFVFDLDALPSTSAVTVSLDGVTWKTPTQSALTRPQPSITSLTPANANGTEFVLSGTNLQGPTTRLLPLDVRALASGDLFGEAIPWNANTADWVADGMAPNGSDLRIFSWDATTPLRHHAETPMNRATTLIWLKSNADAEVNVVSFENRARLYLSYGDASRPATDDPSVLTESFPALGSPQRILHLRAHDLAAAATEGAAIDTWLDRSPLAHLAVAPIPAARPVFRAAAMGGLPALEFDGTSTHLDVNGAAGLGSGPARFFTIYRNPDPGATTWQRLFSSRDNSAVLDYETGYASIPPNNSGTLLPGAAPAINELNRSGQFSGANFRIGRRSLVNADNFRGQIAEMIGFSGDLVGDERAKLLRYLRRKYGMEPRPVFDLRADEPVPELRLRVGGQDALWVVREPDGSLRFGLPPYEGQEATPVTVDFEVILPGGSVQTLSNGFTYTSPSSGEPTTRYTRWALDLPASERDPYHVGFDGRPNLLRFALGEPASGAPVAAVSLAWEGIVSPSLGFLQMSRLRGGVMQGNVYRVDGLGYRLEMSTDLVGWSLLPWQVTASEALSADVERVTLSVAGPNPRRFYRLCVTPE